MSVNLLAFTEEIQDLYVNGTLYESYVAMFKTKNELCMIGVSAAARSSSNFIDQTRAPGAYLDDEIKFFQLLVANAADGAMPGRVDMVWINTDAANSELPKEFKRNAATLEKDFIRVHFPSAGKAPSAGRLVLLDPFLYPFSAEKSLLLEKPAASPEAALDSASPSTRPGSVADWNRAISSYKCIASDNDTPFDTREIASLGEAHDASISDKYSSWLPTDFYVNEDGSVTIQSFINNLHPTQYADLYKSISKVFAKFVPLLEQVATDVLHPPKPRIVFDKEDWYVPGMLHPDTIIEMIKQDKPVPEEYQQFVTSSSAYCHGGQGHTTLQVKDTELDTTLLYKAWEDEMARVKPIRLPYSTPDRPIEPYSVRGLPLQASVEMASIVLTPENPDHSPDYLGHRWQAVGRAQERIFAVGLYFYDVENIVWSRLMFRDPVAGEVFNDSHELKKFSSVLEDVNEDAHGCKYTQEVGSIEIKNGQYICYPNLYQTKTPWFQLADPTKPGHVKSIAFYIADPTTRLISTSVVSPQQPGWANAAEIDECDLANKEAEELKLAHANCNQHVGQRFNVRLTVRQE